MREYAKVAPTFWTGKTGKEIRRRGSEGVVVALYLMSSPHSNMLGLFYQPMLYMAHETGLGIEGATKGLQCCIDAGFCSFDEASEMVWVHEMAGYQIADQLSQGDKRCKGIQKDYEAVPDCPFLGAFFDRYAQAFHLAARRTSSDAQQAENEGPSQAPSKPHRSQEQEQEQEQEPLRGGRRETAPRPARKCPKAFEVTAELMQWARDKHPGVNIPVETEKFRDHTFANAISDWPGAWRNWVRKADEIAQRSGRPQQRHDDLLAGAV